MSRNWTWYRPMSLDETVGLLLEHGTDAFLVAGGTSVGLNPPRKEGLAMIDLQDLDLVVMERHDERIRLGAMATAQDLVASQMLDAVGTGMLRETGAGIGPRPVRNRVTVGGNTMQPFRWSDLPVSMLALGAQFELFGPEGTRTVEADDLFTRQPRRQLRPGELLAWVSTAVDGPGGGGCFEKLTWTAVDHAVVSAAATLSLEDGICRSARIAVGALAPLPQRLPEVEAALIGKTLDEEAIAAAASSAEPKKISGDRRADEGYRRQVVRALVKRVIAKARDRAEAAGKGGGSC